MSSEERIKNQLLYNSVRIRKEGKTVGSGFLYVPVEEQRGEYAYVLTAAHIFDKFDCPLVCQVFYNKRERKEYDFIVQSNQVIIHDNYEKGKGEAIFQEYDAAIIKVPYREWMSQMRVIYFGKPYEFLSVDGITYSSATKDEDIRYDYYIIKETKLNDLYEDSLRMRIQVTGDFILNHANRKMEISGMSGTVLAAENEDIFLTGVFVSIAEANGAFGKANLIKMDAHIELLEKEGLHLVVHELQRENNNLSTYRILSEKGLSSDWHFVHREEDFQKVKRQLESNGLVVLAGMGGIGKTSLARQYACQYKTSYKAVHQISCKESVYKGLAEGLSIHGLPRMKVNGSFETDEQYGLRILKWLRVYETKDSLYLFDDISPNDAALSQIAFLQSDTILISRMPKENWNFPILEIHALESLAEQKALFERYFERELLPEEIEDFSAIASLVNGHTMTLALTAIQIRESAASLKQIREVFERQGVFTEDKVSFPYGENQEERNMYGHIRALYNFSEWQDEEKIMLSILCLIPSIGIGKEELKSILGEDACNSLNRLRRYGWIEESFHGQDRWITLHNVISEIVYREIYLQYNYNFSFFIRYIENAVWNMRNLSFEKQNRYISYGEHLLKRLTDGTDKLDLILILVQQYEYLRKTKEAIEVLQQYERIMTDLGLENTVYHGHYHNNFALIYQRDNDLKTALSHFTEARKIYKNCGKDTIKYYALLLHNEARVRYGLGWHDQALELEEEAEPLLIEHNISYWGYIYDVRGDNYARMAWNSIEKANQNTGLLAVCLQKEAKLYLKKWRICQNKAYKLKKCYNAPEHEVMISLMGRAQAKAFCGNTKGAKKDIQKVFEFRKKKSGARSEAMADVYDKMCIIYEKSGEFEESVRYGQLAVDIFTERFGADSDEVKRAQYNLEFVLNEKK